jgi:nickel/cobalt transporter (NiCoT) family protein
MDAPTNTHDLIGLLAVALTLGLRHGFDADHLAAIDGMTRFNAVARPRLARRTGLWFSLGHGAVVLAAAVSVSLVARSWTAPEWLEPFGAWASIVVLLLLGLMNLNAVRQAPPGAVVAGVGWRSGLFSRMLTASGCWPIMGVGVLFALSFDTLSQAALMAVTGTALRGLPAVIVLAGAFVAGMLITDGINGWWVARLLRRSDRTAARASRVMCIGVACVSLGTALLGVGARLSPAFGAWADAHETTFGLLIVAVIFASFLLGLVVTPAGAPDNGGDGVPSLGAAPRQGGRKPDAVA